MVGLPDSGPAGLGYIIPIQRIADIVVLPLLSGRMRMQRNCFECLRLHHPIQVEHHRRIFFDAPERERLESVGRVTLLKYWCQ